MHPAVPPDPPAPLFDLFDINDDTDAVTTTRELSVTRSKLGDLLDLLPAGLLIHQEQGIVYANLEAERILGVRQDALVGRHFLDFVDGADAAEQAHCLGACLHEHTPVRSLDCALNAADGRRINVQVSMSALPWEGLPVIYVLLNDVTALKRTEETLRHLSVTDSLTGISNRRHFIAMAEREVERAHRYGRPLSLMIMDIDHFKRLNDGFGHAAGDEALVAFTRAVRGALRTVDVFGRLGGEEFAVLLPEADAAGALAVADRIRLDVAGLVIRHDGQPLRFTVSIGVAAWPPGGGTVDEMLSRADAALYRAKARGRNRVETAENRPALIAVGTDAASCG